MLQSDHVYAATHVAMSNEGLLATWSQFDGAVRVWDVRRRALVASFPRAEYVYRFGWSGANLAFYGIDLDGTRRETVDLVGRVIASDKGRFEPIVRGASGDILGALTVRPEIVFTPPGHAPIKLGKVNNLLMVDDARLSMDGKRLLVRSAGNGVAAWSLDAPDTPFTARLSTRAKGIAISPDGDAYAIALQSTTPGSGYRLELGSLRAGTTTLLAERGDFTDASVELAFAPDGSTLVVTDARSLTAYTVATQKLAWSVGGHQWDPKGASLATGFTQPVFTPDGKSLVAQAQHGPVYVVDAVSGRLQGHIGEPLRAPTQLVWTDEGTLVAGSYGHTAIWDTHTGRITQAYDVPSQLMVARLASGDLAVLRNAHCVKMSESRTNLWIDRWAGLEPPVAFLEGHLPDPLLGCSSKEIATPKGSAWPPARGVASFPITIPGNGLDVDLARGLAMVPSKKDFFPSADSVRDLRDGHTVALAKFTPPPRGADDVRLVGGWVFAPTQVGSRTEVGVWNAKTGAHVRDLTLPVRGEFDSSADELVGISEDGRFAAVARSSRLSVFELPSGKSVRDVEIPHSIVGRVGFVDGARDFYVSARSLEGGSLHHVVNDAVTLFGSDPSGRTTIIVPSPSGDRVAMVGQDGAIRVWSAGAHRLEATLAEFADDEFIAYTPGGAYVGTAEVASRVMWVFDAPLEGFSFEQFASLLDQPAVVRRRLAGDEADLASDLPRPPRVEIESATPAADGRTATVKIHVAAPGRVDLVRLFVEGREVASRHV
jgi:WD40 repeat protein